MITIQKTHPIFKEIYWLTSFKTPKNEMRPHCKHLFFNEEEKEICKTDGRTIQCLKIGYDLELEPGYYEIFKRNKSTIMINKTDDEPRFPDYKTIFENKNTEHVQIDEDTLYSSFAAICRAIHKDRCINFNHVETLIRNIDVIFDCQISTEINLPLVLKAQNLRAAVMPMRI